MVVVVGPLVVAARPSHCRNTIISNAIDKSHPSSFELASKLV